MIYPSCLSAPSNDHDLPEMTKSARPEAESKAKADGGPADPRKASPRVRASILALDPHAKIFKVRGHLTVIHSKCGGHSRQKAEDDISHFKEHISVCKGPYTSNGGKSSLKSSLHGRSASAIHRTVAIPTESSPLPCPGFSFEVLFGRDYKSLLNHEREQVTHKADVAGLRWLNSEEKSSVISLSCLEKSSSCQEPAKPCGNCLKVLELSNFKDTLCRETHKSSREVFTPWRSSYAKTISIGEGQKTTNVGWTRGALYPAFIDGTFRGKPSVHTLSLTNSWVVVINIARVVSVMYIRVQ
jgi:hypothetical protein